MCRRITNCITKNRTESGNKIIFDTNICTRFIYIDPLDIFMFLQSKSKSFIPGWTQIEPQT